MGCPTSYPHGSHPASSAAAGAPPPAGSSAPTRSAFTHPPAPWRSTSSLSSPPSGPPAHMTQPPLPPRLLQAEGVELRVSCRSLITAPDEGHRHRRRQGRQPQEPRLASMDCVVHKKQPARALKPAKNPQDQPPEEQGKFIFFFAWCDRRLVVSCLSTSFLFTSKRY